MILQFKVFLAAFALPLILFFSVSAFAQNDAATASGQLSPPPAADANQPQTMTVDQYLDLLKSEVEKGNNEAMITLGIIYERGQLGLDINYGTALDWFTKAAAAKVPEGLFNLGYFYQVGAGTAPDFKKAIDNYTEAAKLGLPMANLRLGNIYLDGKLGVAKSNEKAIQHLTQAGKDGIQDADWQLATLYLNGPDGFPKDIAKGMQLLNSLADKNYSQAINELGAIYYLGQWNQKTDIPKAKGYFLRAADLLNNVAMKNLAAYYKNEGDNKKPNQTLALQWAILSFNFGQNTQEMAAFIQQLRGEMKTEEILAAENGAQDWANKKVAEVREQQQQQQNQVAPATGN
ncbi:MAG: sel1 repeat family protein [Deltaproteobacteria bacterium]|jgi:TPR repeat protein|nr:sel1 repeat family protein [Deltaproteobacteria bacterium]